jgi:protein transport protein SEC31
VATAGEDARALLWSAEGALLHEFPLGGPCFDLRWHPSQPGLLSSCSFDSRVSLHSLHSAGPRHTPAWLRRPAGATFGFGGRLASFAADPAYLLAEDAPQPPQPQRKSHQVSVHALSNDPELVDKSQAFSAAIAAGDLKAFADARTHGASSALERESWRFMRLLLESDARQQLLMELGFKPAAASGAQDAANLSQPKPAQPAPIATPTPSLPDKVFPVIRLCPIFSWIVMIYVMVAAARGVGC